MKPSITKDEYMRHFKKSMPRDKRESEKLNEYLTQQFEQLDKLTSAVSPDNFWENLPKILGIDAKLTLMSELISYDYNIIPINEILRIVETDYRMYFKELCGNEMSAKNKYSMIFNIV